MKMILAIRTIELWKTKSHANPPKLTWLSTLLWLSKWPTGCLAFFPKLRIQTLSHGMLASQLRPLQVIRSQSSNWYYRSKISLELLSVQVTPSFIQSLEFRSSLNLYRRGKSLNFQKAKDFLLYFSGYRPLFQKLWIPICNYFVGDVLLLIRWWDVNLISGATLSNYFSGDTLLLTMRCNVNLISGGTL